MSACVRGIYLFSPLFLVHWCKDWQFKMADLEAVLADVSYLMAMEKSKSTPAARASKKIVLPDPRYCPRPSAGTVPRGSTPCNNCLIINVVPMFCVPKECCTLYVSDVTHVNRLWSRCSVFCFSVRSVMHKHLEKMGEVTFEKIFNQKLGLYIVVHTTDTLNPGMSKIRRELQVVNNLSVTTE